MPDQPPETLRDCPDCLPEYCACAEPRQARLLDEDELTELRRRVIVFRASMPASHIEPLFEHIAVLEQQLTEARETLTRHKDAELRLVGKLVGAHWQNGLNADAAAALEGFFAAVLDGTEADAPEDDAGDSDASQAGSGQTALPQPDPAALASVQTGETT